MIDTVRNSVLMSLQAASATGSTSLLGSPRAPIIDRFVVNFEARSMLKRFETGTLSGVVDIGVDNCEYMLLTETQGGPEMTPVESAGFPAFWPTLPFYWLQGVTSASEWTDGMVRGTASRIDSMARVQDNDREGVAETWALASASQDGMLSEVGYEARIDSAQRISFVRLRFGNTGLNEYAYRYLDEPLPIEAPQSGDLGPYVGLLALLEQA